MIRFKENSYALKIIIKTALAGEFPFKALNMIGDKVMIQRTLRRLREEKYVTVNGSGDAKTIRLTTKALGVLRDYNESYYKHYMSVTDNHHFRGGRYRSNNVGARQTSRRHRLAEVMAFLDLLDVSLWPEDKPVLSLDEREERISSSDYVFYTSREMKNTDRRQRYKTEFTRILGTLFCPGGVYSIYNTNKGRIKWNNQGEQKAQVLVQDIAYMNCDSDFDMDMASSSSVVFGKNMNVMLEILQPPNGRRDANGFELLSFHNTYDNIYYITLDKNGLIQFNIMLEKNWKERLKNIIFPTSMLAYDTSKISIDCDVYSPDEHLFVLMFFDGNLARLKRFKESVYGDDINNFQVLCFPWQEEAVRSFMGTTSDIIPMEYDIFGDKFFS